MQFNDKDCSIVTKGKNNYSCLSDDLLLKISTVINNLNKCDPINKDCTKNYLYNQICDRMNTLSNCKKEACWQTYNHIKNGLTNEEKKEFKDNFKPEMPKEWLEKPDSWLSTEDIDNVLYHLTNRFGPTPQPVNNLIQEHRLRLLAAEVGVVSIETCGCGVVCKIIEDYFPEFLSKILEYVASFCKKHDLDYHILPDSDNGLSICLHNLSKSDKYSLLYTFLDKFKSFSRVYN